MTYALFEPGDRADPADLAAHQEEMARELTLRRHLAHVDIGEDQAIDERGRVVCLWCLEPIDAERLAAEPAAVRHEECQEDHEKHRRMRGER